MTADKKLRIAINGFGRIGRMTLRVLLRQPQVEVVAINDLADLVTMAHLFKYDSIHDRFQGTVAVEEGKGLVIQGESIRCFSAKDPLQLPWASLGVDIVLECTGKFTDLAGAGLHLQAGARRVILSAPPKSNDIKSVVLGVNDSVLSEEDRVISNASCTTNNAAPMLKVLDENWGIESAFVTTVHAYTGDQNLHDAPHKDLRRARAAALSIIPTTTGAAKALGDVLPHLKGRLGGAGVRVPSPDGSLTDITCILKKDTDVASLNSVFKSASMTSLQGIMEYTEDPIVSMDIIGSPYSCIFDAQLTTVLGSMVKVVGWYDNEMGYSNRLVELCLRFANK